MTRLFKIKYIVIVMVALAVITSVTAFSVSYAKWAGGTDSITADMGTGIWDNDVPDAVMGITYTKDNGEKGNLDLTESAFNGYNEFLKGNFIIHIKQSVKVSEFVLALEGVDFNKAIVYTPSDDGKSSIRFENGIFKLDGETSKEEDGVTKLLIYEFNISRMPELDEFGNIAVNDKGNTIYTDVVIVTVNRLYVSEAELNKDSEQQDNKTYKDLLDLK